MTAKDPHAFLESVTTERFSRRSIRYSLNRRSAQPETGSTTAQRWSGRPVSNTGFDSAAIVETPGQPAVIAHAAADTEQAERKVLLYGHYDVQPATASEWDSPPFEPTIREGPDGTDRLYARGAGDNKGQWFAHLCAVRALRETSGLPTDVTLVIEGEEESGSEHLEWLVREHRDELDADVAIVADGPIDESGRPQVLLGSRGLLYIDITTTGANRDLHSGNFGGPVPNPATALADLLSSLWTDDGRIAFRGVLRRCAPAH